MSIMHSLRVLGGVIIITMSSLALAVDEGELAPDFSLPSIYSNKPQIS